jgi:hypothetical protein
MTASIHQEKKDHWIAVFAVAMGIAAYYIPKVIADTVAPDGPILLYLGLGLTLLAPFVCALLSRQRAWRWGLYVIGGQIAFQFVTEPGDMTQFPIGVALYAVLLVPAILSGVLGAYLVGLFIKIRDNP